MIRVSQRPGTDGETHPIKSLRLRFGVKRQFNFEDPGPGDGTSPDPGPLIECLWMQVDALFAIHG